MKRTLIIGLSLIVFIAQGQVKTSAFIEELEALEQVNSFSFSKMMLDAIDITTEDEQGNSQRITGDLHKVSFINSKGEEKTSKEFRTKIHKFLNQKRFTEIDLEEEENQVQVYIDRKGKNISEVHIVINNIEGASLISLFGKIKAEELCAISNALQIGACKQLDKIQD